MYLLESLCGTVGLWDTRKAKGPVWWKHQNWSVVNRCDRRGNTQALKPLNREEWGYRVLPKRSHPKISDQSCLLPFKFTQKNQALKIGFGSSPKLTMLPFWYDRRNLRSMLISIIDRQNGNIKYYHCKDQQILVLDLFTRMLDWMPSSFFFWSSNVLHVLM